MEDSVDSYGLADRNFDGAKGASNVMHAQTVELWTNEKHSLYLKKMEALFVDQLYESFDVSSDQNRLMGSKSSKYEQSGQFKVLRHCYRPKLNWCGNGAGVDKETENSGVVPENRRIQNTRFSGGQAKRKLKASNVKSAYNNSEVTDQNFIDEEKSRRAQRSKRRRSSTNKSSSTDQVVPYQVQGDNAEDR